MVALSRNLAETYFVFHSGSKLANSNCLHFVEDSRFTSSEGVEEMYFPRVGVFLNS